jgi:hypothetical protein
MLAALGYIPFHRNISDVQAHVAVYYAAIKELLYHHNAASGPVQCSVFCEVCEPEHCRSISSYVCVLRV